MPVILFPWGALVLLGVATGTIGSITGAGGGFLLVPILLVAYPAEPVHIVTSISLAVVCVNATSGSVAYARLGRIDWRAGLVFAAAAVPAAVLGALATRLLPRGIFDFAFGLFLMGMAGYLAFGARVVEGALRPQRVAIRKGAASSAVIGFFSSLLGIGGGFIQVPVLTQLLGYPIHMATATSQFVLAFMSLTGTVTHVVMGEFDAGIRRTLALGVGVLIGAQLGARISRRVSGRWVLRSLALGLLIAGLRLVVGSLVV